jgi:cell division septum initiation protein DivIVA
MAREITPNSIREIALRRRLLGYDPHETEQLLAEVAESLERALRDRSSLSQQAAAQRRSLEEAEQTLKDELDRLNEELAARDQRLQELEGELTTMKEERSKHLEDAARLTDELSSAKAADEEHQVALTELRETLGRLETREKALAEQIAMLESQFVHAQEPAPTTHAFAHLDDRAATTLVRLDRAVETIEREAREAAGMILERAREQAKEILRSAEARLRIEAETAEPHTSDEGREEYDPVAALERRVEPSNETPASDRLEPDAGEAAWTSGKVPYRRPERYS